MSASAYELLALAMRYWFILLMGFIVVFLVVAMRREWRIEQAVEKELKPYTGDCALVLLSDEDDALPVGTAYPLQGDASLGSGRGCDIRIKSGSLEREHALLRAEHGRVFVFATGKGLVAVDGKPVKRNGRRIKAGQRLQIGGLVFTVKFDAEEEPWQEES